MDGYELAEQIRRRPELTAVKLVALTGFGHSTDVERAKPAGFDRHVVMPIDLSVLDEILARPS
jgi:two-component system CheB/CheR fusion protein